MSDDGVHPDEMADQVDFESFAEHVLGDLRAEFSSGPDPTPPPALAAVLIGGLGIADLVAEEPAHQGKRRIRMKRRVAALAGQFAGMTAVAKVALAATAVGALAGGGTLATSMISADHPTPVVTVETSTTTVPAAAAFPGASPVGAPDGSEQGDDSSEVDEPGATATSTAVETDDQGEAADHETDAADSETESEDHAATPVPARASSPSTTASSDDESGDSHDSSSSASHDGSDD